MEKLRQKDQKIKAGLGNFVRPGRGYSRGGESSCIGSVPSTAPHNEGYELVKFRLTDSSVS